MEALFHISPREFELLVAALYGQLGYKVEVTPAGRDGGRDVIARRNLAGRCEVVEIECKAHTSAIGVQIVRALRGVVGGSGSNRGVVVTTSRFTRGALKIAADDHRIELVDGATLVQMLNSVFGARWIHDRSWVCRA
ncbi:restriction endonuclease [Lentzea cavernae]|uniref:restriction endonuclease n=1 Tax=Lentzea cavernae TaxID=2020703 RepID=UPI00174EA4AF